MTLDEVRSFLLRGIEDRSPTVPQATQQALRVCLAALDVIDALNSRDCIPDDEEEDDALALDRVMQARAALDAALSGVDQASTGSGGSGT